MEPTVVDGQTSWIIEPDVPRIPKIEGLDPQLPPHIEQRLSYAFDLVQRGATYSANEEFRSVLGLCALEMDARDGGTSHRQALHEAMVALDEADELAGYHIECRESADIQLATAGHSTPVLSGEMPAELDALHTVQRYFGFAEDRFAYACEGLPGASLAYYGLARTFVLPEARYVHAAGKSAMLQRVALRIAPQNALAANELGVLLAQHGHLDQAEALFRQCVATDATPESWQNLAVVYARQGNEDASQEAFAAGAALSAAQQSDKSAAAGSTLASQKSNASPISSDKDTTTESNEKDREPTFWAKLNSAVKLPTVFRR
jgi:tetratricopeptide (TPR) repeat protein